MRNAVLKSISHNISIWLSFVYRKTMRIWEMQVKNRRQGKTERFYFDTIRANVRLSLIHQYIALSRKDKLVWIWKLPIYSYNNFMSHTYFFVKIVCLLNINCYFCRSLLSSDEGNFLIFLLRTVIYYISLQKNPLNFSRRL